MVGFSLAVGDAPSQRRIVGREAGMDVGVSGTVADDRPPTTDDAKGSLKQDGEDGEDGEDGKGQGLGTEEDTETARRE
jgi:hypothetical protein